MKVRIELAENLPEDEVLIRCGRVDENIRKIQQYILEQAGSGPKITFCFGNEEFYLPLFEFLIFETEDDFVYAHTADDSYRIRHRLYELEEILPRYFARAAKSTIVNTLRLRSISRTLASASLIQFEGSHKQVYASRYYYRELRLRMSERGIYEK